MTLWRTLRGRLALASIVGLVVATAAFTLLGLQMVRTQSFDREARDLDSKARSIAKLISEEFATGITSGRASYDPSSERIATLEAIAGENTQLIYMGPRPNPSGDSALVRGVVSQVRQSILDRDGIQRFEFTDDNDVRRIASAAPLRYDDETIGAVVLTRERAALFSLWQDIAGRVILACALGLIVAVVISLILTSRAMRPIRRLQVAALAVGRGDLETRVADGGPEEVAALSAAFNTMVRELRRRDQVNREFLMRVTHDLRTPLTAIRGHTQALADGIVPTDQIPRSLAAIDGESERLGQLVTDLLDLGKLEARRFHVDLDDVDANDLIARAFLTHEAEAAQQDIRYLRESTPLPPMVTDGPRLRRIVANLIDNALKWTPAGGTITLSSHPLSEDLIEISVSDSGPGIPDAHRQSIFDPFWSQTSPDGHSGSGLGLTISRQLANVLGGSLVVEDAPDGGARFVLTLPTVYPNSGANPPEIPLTPLTDGDAPPTAPHERGTVAPGD